MDTLVAGQVATRRRPTSASSALPLLVAPRPNRLLHSLRSILLAFAFLDGGSLVVVFFAFGEADFEFYATF